MERQPESDKNKQHLEQFLQEFLGNREAVDYYLSCFSKFSRVVDDGCHFGIYSKGGKRELFVVFGEIKSPLNLVLIIGKGGVIVQGRQKDGAQRMLATNSPLAVPTDQILPPGAVFVLGSGTNLRICLGTENQIDEEGQPHRLPLIVECHGVISNLPASATATAKTSARAPSTGKS